MRNAISSAFTAIPKSLHLYEIEKVGNTRPPPSFLPQFTSNGIVITSQLPQLITFFIFFAMTKGPNEMKKKIYIYLYIEALPSFSVIHLSA